LRGKGKNKQRRIECGKRPDTAMKPGKFGLSKNGKKLRLNLRL